MDQNGSFPSEGTGEAFGAGQAAVSSRSVFEASRRVADAGSNQDGFPPAPAHGSAYREGLAGSLVLQGVEALTQDETSVVLSRLDALVRWAQAQQAKVLHRMEILFRDEARRCRPGGSGPDL